jgi:probable phosphoglycerate mutase
MADAATVVLLVRHGLTPTTGIKLPGQAPGLHLTEEGRRQAEAAAARIKALPRVAAVYSSHLERARETAAPIARLRGLALRIDRDLADLDIGAWTGLSLKQAARRPEWETVQRNPSGFRFPDGESFRRCRRASPPPSGGWWRGIPARSWWRSRTPIRSRRRWPRRSARPWISSSAS